MTEITIDIRYIGYGLIAIAVFVIIAAFISLIRSNSALRRKLREYEERESKERFRERYSDTDIEAVDRSAWQSYTEKEIERILGEEVKRQKAQQQYSPITARQTQYNTDDPDYDDLLNAEPTLEKRGKVNQTVQKSERMAIESEHSQAGANYFQKEGSTGAPDLRKKKTNLKQLIKDPITSAEDAAARKKVFKRFMWVFIGSAVLFSVLQNLKIPVLSSIASIMGLISFFLFMADLLLLSVIKKSAKAFNERTCETCKTLLIYNDIEDWSAVSVERRLSENDQSSNLKEYTTVQFKCVCPKCGTKKSFTHEFCTANITATGERIIVTKERAYDPLEKQIKDYFEGHLTIVYKHGI